MKKELKITAMQLAFVAAIIAAAYFVAGCTSPKKVRDIELKGMYVNGYSEVVAIGAGRLTSIPGEREALAAHYEEDTAWLSPSTKTHKFDIFLVGTNSVENSTEIISSICKAFSDVAPQVSATHAANAGGTSAFDVVKGGGEVRKAVALAKQEVEKIKASKADGQKVEDQKVEDQQTQGEAGSANGESQDGNSTDGEVK
ncbi:MAG: hypothetical protein II840_11650 [Kiritimatiellae bacterium]|nr:hypothetical protein [Kiritimatiellia bacterium]